MSWLYDETTGGKGNKKHPAIYTFKQWIAPYVWRGYGQRLRMKLIILSAHVVFLRKSCLRQISKVRQSDRQADNPDNPYGVWKLKGNLATNQKENPGRK